MSKEKKPKKREIFSEVAEVGSFTKKWYHAPYRPRTLGGVEETRYRVKASVIAFWDKVTQVLFVRFRTNADEQGYEWAPVDYEFLGIMSTREMALRKTITAANEWYTTVRVSIPADDTRTDEQVAGAAGGIAWTSSG